MTDETELLKKRLLDLDRSSSGRDIVRSSGFLSLSEQAAFRSLEREFRSDRALLAGGHSEADRQIALFLPAWADAAEEERRLISCILVEQEGGKFEQPPGHRDVLGALMNLGIERDRLGDILTDGPSAYVFCSADMAGFIRENLTRVRHSSVSCREAPEGTELTPRFEELSLNVASERADCVLAALWKLPRSEAQKLFASEKVFADGRVLADPGRTLKEESRISVRGFGKFIYGGTEGKSRSGRLFVHIRRFV